MGTRGVPARYGGFETFAEELGVRLAARGHRIVVYCRRASGVSVLPEPDVYRDIQRIVLPAVRHKYLETISHTFLSTIHALFHPVDVVLLCNGANAIFAWVLRVRGQKVVINVDGIERKRAKWNAAGRVWYALGERLSTLTPDRFVSDAEVIRHYYLVRYGKDSTMIPYGAPVRRQAPADGLAALGLEPARYVLFVSRLEPENGAHTVIRAFEGVHTDLRLAIVGDAPYAKHYIASLRSTKDPRIVFTGAIYGDGYRTLQENAYCYVQASEVGGTHPALLEAMGAGNLVLARSTPENREVLGEAGRYFSDAAELRRELQAIADDPVTVEQARVGAMQRVRQSYSWDSVTDRYEALFHELVPDGLSVSETGKGRRSATAATRSRDELEGP